MLLTPPGVGLGMAKKVMFRLKRDVVARHRTFDGLFFGSPQPPVGSKSRRGPGLKVEKLAV
jgi:hypothetical protein